MFHHVHDYLLWPSWMCPRLCKLELSECIYAYTANDRKADPSNQCIHCSLAFILCSWKCINFVNETVHEIKVTPKRLNILYQFRVVTIINMMTTIISKLKQHMHYPHAVLTKWSRVTHMCVRKITIIGTDNGLSPGRRHAIIWTNALSFLIRPLGTNQLFLSKSMHFIHDKIFW